MDILLTVEVVDEAVIFILTNCTEPESASINKVPVSKFLPITIFSEPSVVSKVK